MASSLDEDIRQLAANFEAVRAKVGGNNEARKELLGKVQSWVGQLKAPEETVWESFFVSVIPAALLSLVEMGAVDKINATQGSISAADLAKSCGADELLVVRLIRALTPVGYIKEEGERLYSSTPILKLFGDPAFRGGVIFINHVVAKACVNLPEYLQKDGYRNVDTYPGPFQHAFKTDHTLFRWLHQHPHISSSFNAFMAQARVGQPDWYTIFPTDKILLEGAVPDLPLLVDVGGGRGHDLQGFHRAYPNAPGKLVLQDLPEVIDDIKSLDAAIERVPHDFFTPQPIQGARAYYVRQILHDHGDEDCLRILSNLKAAMKPGYSKILCNEFCLPDQGVPLNAALLDLTMFSLLNAMERTRKQWYALMDRAGLKIVEIYHDPTGTGESLIEVELP